MKSRMERIEQRLTAFENEHMHLRTTPAKLLPTAGSRGETQHTSSLVEIDELGRQLVAASTDRILREAQYRSRFAGRPGVGHRLRPAPAGSKTQLCHGSAWPADQARRSELEQEQAQLSAEHGPNFPRVVEIRGQLQDLDRQKQAEDARWSSNSAAPGRLRSTASNWCARISPNSPPKV
jgi:hypothetical protein